MVNGGRCNISTISLNELKCKLSENDLIERVCIKKLSSYKIQMWGAIEKVNLLNYRGFMSIDQVRVPEWRKITYRIRKVLQDYMMTPQYFDNLRRDVENCADTVPTREKCKSIHEFSQVLQTELVAQFEPMEVQFVPKGVGVTSFVFSLQMKQAKFAVKVVHHAMTDEQLREIQLLNIMNHENVLRLFHSEHLPSITQQPTTISFLITKEYTYSLFDMIAKRKEIHKHSTIRASYEMGGKVVQRLNNTLTLNDVYLFKIMKGLLQGLVYIHSLNIAHRDIKVDNIYVQMGSSPDDFSIVYADFGAADTSGSSHIKGTWSYMPKEAIYNHYLFKKSCDQFGRPQVDRHVFVGLCNVCSRFWVCTIVVRSIRRFFGRTNATLGEIFGGNCQI